MLSYCNSNVFLTPPRQYPETNRTLGHHIASRLVDLGVTDYFAIPGDFNLVLLDQLLEDKRLKMIACCNELNAGYAADGYARSHGISCVVVTFCVGGMSLVNALAGAYSENLPLICISGGPNTNEFGSKHILHHTTAIPGVFGQQLEMMKQVTCHQEVITRVQDACTQIDRAISQALIQSKPVYIEISCNIAGISSPHFALENYNRMRITLPKSNPESLKGAVKAAAEVLGQAVKPVLVGGVKLRSYDAMDAFARLMRASSYATAAMPNAKGMVDETLPEFIGTYWGAVSSPSCREIIESSDCYLLAGPIINDYTSAGYTTQLKDSKMILVDQDHVVISDKKVFNDVYMAEFLDALAEKVYRNPFSLDFFKRIHVPYEKNAPRFGETLTGAILHEYVQGLLGPGKTVIAETGDSWFWGQKLRLPSGCGYEFQMQYGSIGWSVGAVLGYAVAAKADSRVIALIGDGSFQMTAQEVSSMIRYGLNPIIFLINNGGYTIEVEIHDGPYNVIKNWNYTGFIEAMANNEGKLYTAKVRTENDLKSVIEDVKSERYADHLCFVEVFLDKDDCSRELLEWGNLVATNNGKPPAV